MRPLEIIDITIPNAGKAVAIGNLELLNERRAALLNSRHGKFPDAGANWIRTTLRIAEELVQSGVTIVSSVGMFTWELVTWKVGACGGNLIIVIPETPRENADEITDDILRDFNLDINRILIIFPNDPPHEQVSLSDFPMRDAWIAAIADVLYPIAVRPGGNLAGIAELFRTVTGKVNEQCRIPYEKTTRSSFRSEMNLITREEVGQPWGSLTHWTRASVDPWPEETKADFYTAFEKNEDGYPRSAFHTLKRILKQRCLIASKKLIRGREKVVSLTACPPWELGKLVKWRPNLLRWTFEPYGIALNRSKLESLGAQPVVYGENYQYRFLKDGDKSFFQSCGHGENNWRAEKEWRYIGDLDLNLFNPEDVTVFVFTREEADMLQRESPFQVSCWKDYMTNLH